MIRRFLPLAFVAAALGLANCAAPPRLAAPAEADLRSEIQSGEKPTTPVGACWASDQTPAVIETVTEQVAEDAALGAEGGYRTETQQDIVQPRQKIWFRTPCADVLTPYFITTLQRALAARGLYAQPPSGELDPDTRVAIRAYQQPRGLNSDRLSLAAARDLGVITADFGQAFPENPVSEAPVSEAPAPE